MNKLAAGYTRRPSYLWFDRIFVLTGMRPSMLNVIRRVRRGIMHFDQAGIVPDICIVIDRGVGLLGFRQCRSPSQLLLKSDNLSLIHI